VLRLVEGWDQEKGKAIAEGMESPRQERRDGDRGSRLVLRLGVGWIVCCCGGIDLEVGFPGSELESIDEFFGSHVSLIELGEAIQGFLGEVNGLVDRVKVLDQVVYRAEGGFFVGPFWSIVEPILSPHRGFVGKEREEDEDLLGLGVVFVAVELKVDFHLVEEVLILGSIAVEGGGSEATVIGGIEGGEGLVDGFGGTHAGLFFFVFLAFLWLRGGLSGERIRF
jgi:hypothetical protein